jgi:hypothetical protein
MITITKGENDVHSIALYVNGKHSCHVQMFVLEKYDAVQMDAKGTIGIIVNSNMFYDIILVAGTEPGPFLNKIMRSNKLNTLLNDG